MSEVVIWTVIFFGGDLLVMLALTAFAIRKDLERARSAE